MNDQDIKKILEESKTIAMIGVSSEKKKEDPKNIKRKPANVVMKYMQGFGYKVIPINPFAEGEIINGEKVIKDLEDINTQIDIVDVFRPSKEASITTSPREPVTRKNGLDVAHTHDGVSITSRVAVTVAPSRLRRHRSSAAAIDGPAM